MLAQGLCFRRELRIFGFVVVVAAGAGAVAEVFVEVVAVAGLRIGGVRAWLGGIGGAAVRRGAAIVIERAASRRWWFVGFLAAAFVALEQRVVREEFLDFLIELQRRQLQQPDRLLQLRSERQVLRQPELERMLHDS